jgi:two-component system, NarL family, nitrate/nitrite response regulator NarL
VTGTFPTIRILLVHEQTLIREALKRLLECEPDFELVTACGTIRDAQDAIGRQQIDVAVLDLEPGGTNGVGLLWTLRERGFAGPIVILTAHLEPSQSTELFAAGSTGFVFKESPPDTLSECIRQVFGGGVWIDQAHMRDFIKWNSTETNQAPQRLTARERDVLAAVLEGLTTKIIAHQLQISESAVKSALQQLFRKTGVKTRSQLVRLAIEKYSAQLQVSKRHSSGA